MIFCKISHVAGSLSIIFDSIFSHFQRFAIKKIGAEKARFYRCCKDVEWLQLCCKRFDGKTLKQSTWPLFNVMLTTLGRIPGKDAACNDRSAKFLITYSLERLDPDNDKPCIAEVEALRLKLLPLTEGGSQNV